MVIELSTQLLTSLSLKDLQKAYLGNRSCDFFFQPSWLGVTLFSAFSCYGHKFSASSKVLPKLRAIIRIIGEDVLGFKDTDIGLHSLRSGGAMAMFLLSGGRLYNHHQTNWMMVERRIPRVHQRTSRKFHFWSSSKNVRL